MLGSVKRCIERIMLYFVSVYKFSVFSFYMYQKYLFPFDSDDDSDDADEFSSYNRLPLADDIENMIPKLN